MEAPIVEQDAKRHSGPLADPHRRAPRSAVNSLGPARRRAITRPSPFLNIFHRAAVKVVPAKSIADEKTRRLILPARTEQEQHLIYGILRQHAHGLRLKGQTDLVTLNVRKLRAENVL